MAAAIEPGVTASERDLSGRGRILREARRLFTDQGFAAVSMQQIADAAAINKATLYHHFQDKEDLFVSVMAEEFARMGAGLGASIAEPASLREQLQRVAAHVLASRHSDFGRLSADLRVHVSEQKRSALMDNCSAPWSVVRVAIEQAIERGEVRQVDAELVARMFFAMVGSQIWWSRFGTVRPEPDEGLPVMLADLLLDGIGLAGSNSPENS
jgi:AcrR family transcriptional regulator